MKNQCIRSIRLPASDARARMFDMNELLNILVELNNLKARSGSAFKKITRALKQDPTTYNINELRKLYKELQCN